MFLYQSIDHLESFFNQREPQISAFLPEADRFERLRREARSLGVPFPNPETRPPLYSILVGVKDILHVEGFPTHAGSRLPPEVLQLPAGNNPAGLPLGLQVAASWYADEQLLAWSAVLEQVISARNRI